METVTRAQAFIHILIKGLSKHIPFSTEWGEIISEIKTFLFKIDSFIVSTYPRSGDVQQEDHLRHFHGRPEQVLALLHI